MNMTPYYFVGFLLIFFGVLIAFADGWFERKPFQRERPRK